MSVTRYGINVQGVFTNLTDGGYVSYQDYEKLAAENANKSRCLGFFASVIKSGEEWTSVCQHEYSEALKAPATHAFLAEVRAQGVDMFAAVLRRKGDDAFFDAIAEGQANAADQFAAQIRKGVQS